MTDVRSSTLATFLVDTRSHVDSALERFLPGPPACPALLTDAMRYSLLGGGKRLRPLLAVAAADAIARRTGAPVLELALPAACALEFIHTYSLIHDDLPAMDNDTMRRGRPTAHVVFGEGIAILAGDALLTDAFSLLAREPALSADVAAEELSRRKLETVAIVAEAAGAAGMVGGQTLDLLAVRPDAAPLDGAALREMHMRKTGALIIASSLAGAVMGGATPEQMEAVGRYALQVGLAFQIVDDILDVEGVEAEIGKTPGKDAAAGKPTYPALYGLDESKRLAAECAARAIAALDNAGLSGQLPAIARWVVGRTN